MADSLCLQFGDCEIDVAGFSLHRNGRPCEVEPQVLELLLYLARHPDRLITRDDLIRHVWHGRIVSDTTITSRIKSARQAIGDDGTQQKFIRTVHGRGVRFVGAISTRPCRTGVDLAANRAALDPAPADGVPGDMLARARAAAESASDPRTWPAIAVLPFANLSDDKDQDYFADGVTEDIITDLSRFRELRVVARDSCFQHRTPGADLQRIGRALGADYIVTGSIRRRAAKLRVTAQLTAIDGGSQSGNQIWAERFDRNAEDLFAMADELVRTIAGTVVGRVRQVGSVLARRKPPANLAAYECVLRGQAAQAQIGDPAQEAAARHFFEQALALDPDYPRAHAGLAIVLLCEWVRAPDDAPAILCRALEHAERAVALDDEDHECRETLGWVLLHCKAYYQCELHYRRALELNPNCSAVLTAMGAVIAYLGRPEEALQWFELAQRVDPYFEATWYWHLLGTAYFIARRYDDAVTALERAPNSPLWADAYAAAAHAMAGRLDTARKIAATIGQESASFCAATMARKEPYKNAEDLEHLEDGLRKAGLLPHSQPANDAAVGPTHYVAGGRPFAHAPQIKLEAER